VDTTTHLPLHYDQLMSKRRVFCLKSALRPERRGEQGQDEAEQRDHSAPTLGDSLNMEQGFGTHKHLLTLLIVIMGGPQRMIATRAVP
jgi:hypothetical protein